MLDLGEFNCGACEVGEVELEGSRMDEVMLVGRGSQGKLGIDKMRYSSAVKYGTACKLQVTLSCHQLFQMPLTVPIAELLKLR